MRVKEYAIEKMKTINLKTLQIQSGNIKTLPLHPPTPSPWSISTLSSLTPSPFSSPFLHLPSSPQASLQSLHSLPIIPRGA